MNTPPHPRPGPLRLLTYAFYAPLPDEYREWVLHDATCSTWVLRQVGRTLLMALLPVAAIALFLPADGGVRALVAFVTGACAVMFVTLYVNEATEYRLIRAGYPWGTGERVRTERAEAAEFRARLNRWDRRERRAARRRQPPGAGG